MAEDGWATLRRYFSAASVLQGAERQAFVARVAGENARLGEQLEALLRGADKDGVLTQAVRAAAADAASDRRSSIIGRHFGPYRVQSHLASGGMGDVYLAERADGTFEQRAAVKLIGIPGMPHDLAQRFRSEGRILARLTHPNIARILDGGTTAEGTPYLVMEYVEGVPIDEYCAAHALSVRRRLELFRSVCAALEYAHRNLVVHRDIKPSNILVTREGVPKLLDFGIAKLLDAEEHAETTRMTMRVMTTDYASPEQVLGLPITTASDVYALGILLYRLLADKNPYKTAGLRPSEVEKLVCDTSPARPSHAILQHAPGAALPVGARARSREVAGDLDRVVQKAMRKEPELRYASAGAFSADVRRYLEGRPVEATGRTWHYVVRKLVTRKPVPVAAAVVLALAGAAGILYHSQSITAERDRVRAEASKRAAVADFLVDIFKVSDPDSAQGATITAKQILDAGAARLHEDLAGQPAVRATLSHTIGTVYGYLGLYEQALEQLREAVSLLETAGDAPALAESLRELGNVHYERGEFEEARAVLERALTVARDAAPGDRVETAIHLNDLAHVTYAQGAYDAAVRLYEQARSMHERLGATDHWNYADTLHDLGQVWQLQGKLEDAERVMSRAIDRAIENNGERHTTTVAYMHNLAALLHEMDEFARAEGIYLRVIDLERELLGEDHPDREAAMTNLGRLYSDMGRLEDAEAYLRQAVEHAARTRGPRHVFTAYDSVNLANLLTVRGDYPESRRLFEEALAIYGETVSDDHPYIASAATGYAGLLNLMEQPEMAERQARRALEICEVSLPPGHWLAASASSALGEALMLQGDVAAAEPLLLESYPVVAAARPRDRMTVNALRRLVRLYELREDPDEAAHYAALLQQTRASRP